MEDEGVLVGTEYRKWYSAEKIRTERGRPKDLPGGAGSRRYTSWMMVYIVGSLRTNYTSAAHQGQKVQTWGFAQDVPVLGD
jgi:hypothetical protein